MSGQLYRASFFHTGREFWRGKAANTTEARAKARAHMKRGYKGEAITITPVYEGEA